MPSVPIKEGPIISRSAMFFRIDTPLVDAQASCLSARFGLSLGWYSHVILHGFAYPNLSNHKFRANLAKDCPIQAISANW